MGNAGSGKMACPACRSPLQEIPQTAENDWRCAKCGGRLEGVGKLRRTLGGPEAEGLWRRARAAAGTGKPCPACRTPMAACSLVVSKEPASLELCVGCSFVWMGLAVHQRVFGTGGPAADGRATAGSSAVGGEPAAFPSSPLDHSDLAGLRWDAAAGQSRARAYFRFLAGSAVVMNMAYPVFFGWKAWKGGAPGATPDLLRAQFAIAVLFNAGMLAVWILLSFHRIFQSEDDVTGRWFRGRWMEAVPKGVHQLFGWLMIHVLFLFWVGAFWRGLAGAGR